MSLQHLDTVEAACRVDTTGRWIKSRYVLEPPLRKQIEQSARCAPDIKNSTLLARYQGSDDAGNHVHSCAIVRRFLTATLVVLVLRDVAIVRVEMRLTWDVVCVCHSTP